MPKGLIPHIREICYGKKQYPKIQIYSAFKRPISLMRSLLPVHTKDTPITFLPVPQRKMQSNDSYKHQSLLCPTQCCHRWRRFIILSAIIDTQILTLVNVYVPNTAQGKFYKKVRNKLGP